MKRKLFIYFAAVMLALGLTFTACDVTDGGISDTTNDVTNTNTGGTNTSGNDYGNYSWKLLGLIGTTTDYANTRPISIKIGADNNPIVAFRDSENGHKLTVKKYNGTTWTALGGVGVSLSGVRWVSMDMDSSGNPYVAYYDYDTLGNGTVQHWNGTSWEGVGNPGEAAIGTFDYGVMSVDSTDKPEVFYRNANDSHWETSSRKWDGSAWGYLGGLTMGGRTLGLSHTYWKKDGTTPLSVVAIEEYCINSDGNIVASAGLLVYNTVSGKWEPLNEGAANPLGGEYITVYASIASYGTDLYIAYKGTAGKLFFTEWEPEYPNSMPPNGNWNGFGLDVSDGTADYIQMIVDNNGNPIVAYRDGANGNKVTVKKCVDYMWITLGTAGCSFGAADWVSIDVDANNIVYLAYRDLDNNNAVTVMKFTEGTGTTTIAVPSAPVVKTIATNLGSVDVTWDAVENATAYEFYYSTTDNNTTPAPTKVDVSGTAYTMTGLTNGTTYYMWLKAKNSTGTSDFGAGTNATTPSDPPLAPGVPSVVIADSQLEISWVPVDRADSYEVWYHTGNDTNFASQQGGVITGTNHSLTGLVNGTPYYIWLKAVNGDGASPFSDYANGTPAATPKQWTALGGMGFGTNCYGVTSVRVDSAGNVFYTYNDNGYGNSITVRKWNTATSNWDVFGVEGFGGVTHGHSMEIRGVDDPVIITRVPAYSYGTVVYENNGGSWDTIGVPDISSTVWPGDYGQGLTFDGSGNPVVSYYRHLIGVGAMKFDGTDWNQLGSGLFHTNGRSQYNSFKTRNDSNKFVLAVTEEKAGGTWPYTMGARVKEWDGSAWHDLPLPETNDGDGYNVYQSGNYIQVDNSDNIYMLYPHVYKGLVVYKYTGSWDSGSWTKVGGEHKFTLGSSYGWALALDSSGNPIVAYTDSAYGTKLFVKKFNGTEWETIGNEISDGKVSGVSMDTYGDEIYITFQDYAHPYQNTVLAYK